MAFIKYFESTDAGAPTMNNAAGSMISVLDACLITGYNNKAVASITVSAGVATVVCNGHGFSNGYAKIIRIAGATPAGLNGDCRIDNVSTNGFTFLCPGVADGAATGTISAKYAPLDWVKQFSGTNKAMYKRSDITATGCMLRVDDAVVGRVCRVLMVEAATGIDTYNNPSPLATQITDGLGQYWCKGYDTSAAAPWFLVADDKLMYLFVGSYSPRPLVFTGHAFGDVVDFKPGSVLGCMLAGYSNVSFGGYPLRSSSNDGCWVIAGALDGITRSADLNIQAKTPSYGTGGVSYPSSVDGGLVIAYPVLVSEGNFDGYIRGIVPGLAIPLANISTVIPVKTKISNLVGSSRVFLVSPVNTSTYGGLYCVPLLDLTGPWG